MKKFVRMKYMKLEQSKWFQIQQNPFQRMHIPIPNTPPTKNNANFSTEETKSTIAVTRPLFDKIVQPSTCLSAKTMR